MKDSKPQPSPTGAVVTFTTKNTCMWYNGLCSYYFDAYDPHNKTRSLEWKENLEKNPLSGIPLDTSVKYTKNLSGFVVMIKLYDHTQNGVTNTIQFCVNKPNTWRK